MSRGEGHDVRKLVTHGKIVAYCMLAPKFAVFPSLPRGDSQPRLQPSLAEVQVPLPRVRVPERLPNVALPSPSAEAETRLGQEVSRPPGKHRPSFRVCERIGRKKIPNQERRGLKAEGGEKWEGSKSAPPPPDSSLTRSRLPFRSRSPLCVLPLGQGMAGLRSASLRETIIL